MALLAEATNGYDVLIAGLNVAQSLFLGYLAFKQHETSGRMKHVERELQDP